MAVSARVENLASWFAASVLVAAGVIYALKLEDDRPRPNSVVPPRATPAQEPPTLQQRRATEPGRGRHAHVPQRIPWRGWKDILVRTYREIQDDRLLALAAGVAFYSLIALFPAIAAGVSSYALFANAASISKHLAIAADIVPTGGLDLLRDEITRIAAESDGKLTFGFLVGLCIALWSANAGMKAIFDALNIIYDEEEKRSLIRLNMASLFFTICAIAGAGLAVTLVVVFPLFLAAFGVTSSEHPIVAYLRWPVMFVLIIFALSVLYRYGPSRRRAKWRWISFGGVFAALACARAVREGCTHEATPCPVCAVRARLSHGTAAWDGWDKQVARLVTVGSTTNSLKRQADAEEDKEEWRWPPTSVEARAFSLPQSSSVQSLHSLRDGGSGSPNIRSVKNAIIYGGSGRPGTLGVNTLVTWPQDGHSYAISRFGQGRSSALPSSETCSADTLGCLLVF
jgi:membrane protein